MSEEADVFEQFVQLSHSPNAEVRTVAVQQILELPNEALLQLLSKRSRYTGANSRRITSRMLAVIPYAALVFAIVNALCKATSADPRIVESLTLLCFCFAAVLVVTWGWGARSVGRYGRALPGGFRKVQRLPVSMVVLLAGRTDARFLPYLLSEVTLQHSLFERAKPKTPRLPSMLSPMNAVINAIGNRRPPAPHECAQSRRRYRKIVQAILAQIGPEESIELTAEERYGLLLLLRLPEEDVQLTLDILVRLPVWGDAQTVPVLKRLIREKHWYVGSEQVETAARRCLEELETRLKRQNQGSTLLRPVGGSEGASPQTLLRPAGDTPENAPEQLLRPESARPPEGPG